MNPWDAAFAQLPPPQRSIFEHITEKVEALAPGVERVISYGMPSFKYKGKILLHMGAFKNHISLFPASDEMVEVLGEQLAKHRVSTGTLKFTDEEPLTDELLEEIIAYRKATIDS